MIDSHPYFLLMVKLYSFKTVNLQVSWMVHSSISNSLVACGWIRQLRNWTGISVLLANVLKSFLLSSPSLIRMKPACDTFLFSMEENEETLVDWCSKEHIRCLELSTTMKDSGWSWAGRRRMKLLVQIFCQCMWSLFVVEREEAEANNLNC